MVLTWWRVFIGVPGYLNEVQRELHRSLKGVLRIFLGSFRGVQSFLNASRKFQWCFKEDYRILQWSLKWVLIVFKRSLMVVSRKIEWVSKRPLKEIQGRFKGLKGGFKEVSRQFQRRLKKVSSVFIESVKCLSRKFHKKLLYGSHRSYPSRRRASYFTLTLCYGA